MKNINAAWLIAIVASLTLAGSGRAQARPPASAVAVAPPHAKGTDDRAKLPRDVTIYAATDIGGGQRCLVGESDKEGMNEKPVVYLASARGGFAWHVQLHILKGAYQGRVTHCVASANEVYVLLQIDTDSLQSANRTLLQVAALRRKTGAVAASKFIDVPNVSADYTSWVDMGADNFKLERSRLVIKGQFDLMSERDDPSGRGPTPFAVEVPASLRP